MRALAIFDKHWLLGLILIALIGLLLRSYGLFAPWGVKDHYNFGGPFFSRFVFCLSHSDWSETRGRIHTGCAAERDIALSPLIDELTEDRRSKLLAHQNSFRAVTGEAHPSYYLKHPPFYPWLLYYTTHYLGNSEWVFRAVTLIFSVLNIFLVGLLGRRVFQSNIAGLFCATLQAGFLGAIYFGTHVDYMNEINATFILLGVFFALSARWTLAVGAAVVGGLIDWPGLLILPPLFLLSVIRKDGRVITFLGNVAVPIIVFAVAAFLMGTEQVVTFFVERVFASNHHAEVTSSTSGGAAFLVTYFKILIKVHSRLLGPILFAAGLWVGVKYIGAIKKTGISASLGLLADRQDLQVIFLLGSTTAIIAILGAPYVMIHPFWFVPTLSLWAFVIASGFRPFSASKTGQEPIFEFPTIDARWPIMVLIVLTAALYPFGIFKSAVWIDLLASLLIISSVFLSMVGVSRCLKPITMVSLAFAIGGNFMQVVNYRTEEPVDKAFCLMALNRYIDQGEGVDLGKNPILARKYYCLGIPGKSPLH
jgi:hypothetical protein